MSFIVNAKEDLLTKNSVDMFFGESKDFYSNNKEFISLIKWIKLNV